MLVSRFNQLLISNNYGYYLCLVVYGNRLPVALWATNGVL